MNTVNFFTILEKMESDAAALYQQLADSHEGELRDILLRFHEQESSHVQIMQDLQASTHNLEQDAVDHLLSLAASAPDKDKVHLSSTKDAFLLALKMEKEGLLLYSEMLSLTSADSPSYNILQNLVDMERSHMYTLLQILHSLD